MTTTDPIPLLLLVDDDTNAIRLLTRCLKSLGQVQFATSGAEALAQANRIRPDLVLLDAQMPGMTGYETCQALRALPGCTELPILFVTARTDPESESQALGLGAVDFLHKPINPPVVQARVRTHLMLKQRTDELRQANQELESRVALRTAELQAALIRAEASNAAKTEFLNNMTHELNTPLHAILSLSKRGRTAASKVPGQEKLVTHFEHIISAGARIHLLVSTLLDLAGLSTGSGGLEMVHHDLIPLAQAAIKVSQTAASAKRQSIELKGPATASLFCNGERIQQVFHHLLSNASNYSPPDSKIEVAIAGGDLQWQVTVTDEGVGVPEGELESIFEHFSQGSLTKTGAGGTGLGLALCKKIVVAHGGTIRVLSKGHGSGTACEVTLPRAPRR